MKENSSRLPLLHICPLQLTHMHCAFYLLLSFCSMITCSTSWKYLCFITRTFFFHQRIAYPLLDMPIHAIF